MRKLFFILLLAISCGKKTEDIQVQSENFEEFNQHFHSDSVFQLSRIKFPVEGIHRDGWEEYKWTKENWEILKNPVTKSNPFPNEYKHQLISSDTLVIEKYWIEDSGFQCERKFQLIKDKWFMVSYYDMNL